MSTKVKITNKITICDHCSKNNLKRVMEIKHKKEIVYIGVICAGKVFNLNLSGNPYEAAKRLEFHINNNISKNEIKDILDELKEGI